MRERSAPGTAGYSRGTSTPEAWEGSVAGGVACEGGGARGIGLVREF